MDLTTQRELLSEIITLREADSAYLDPAAQTAQVSHYFDAERFAREREAVHRGYPQALRHASELPEPNSFLRHDFAGLPLLLTRDQEGRAHAFLNVCRHRGTRLVEQNSGCKRRFACPYHAWTWDNRGELVSVPHQQQGFPDLDTRQFALQPVACVERYGMIWVHPGRVGTEDLDGAEIDRFLAGLGTDLNWVNLAGHTLLHSSERLCKANWKLLVEGGLEAYHFRVAHRHSIGPHFKDNLSTYRQFGLQLRSVLAKASIDQLGHAQPDQTEQPDGLLRQHSQLLYSLFPSTALLVQSDHIAWVQISPIASDVSLVKTHTLVPSDRLASAADLAHWQKNHDITVTTLNEDFDLAESIQAGLESGANSVLNFGRFEGALGAFNQNIDACLEAELKHG